ncbi:hypothetical protein DL96DRAFT_1820931 [Flagelloscypha sp. PMI_526]|nr:hypothetical protein DL96DRAFT_1820931 [Flagelloscypha sp. PMI_526]
MPSTADNNSWVSQWLASQRTEGPKFGDAAASYYSHPTNVAAPRPMKPFSFTIDDDEDEEIVISSPCTMSLDPLDDELSWSSPSSSPASTPSPTPSHPPRTSCHSTSSKSRRRRRRCPSRLHHQSLEAIREEPDVDD